MSAAIESDRRVVHVVMGDSLPAQIDTLRVLRAAAGTDHFPVVHLGFGRAPVVPNLRRSRLAVNAAIRSSHAIAQQIETRSGSVVLHAWSPRATANCMLALGESIDARDGRVAGLVVDAAGPDAAEVARHLREVEGRLVVRCPTQLAFRKLIAAGVGADMCVVIHGSFDEAVLRMSDRVAARKRLGLNETDDAVLILPPLTRESGGFVVAWAALLAERIRPTIRLVVPGADAEVERVRYLVESCRRGEMLRMTGGDWRLPELLAAVDVAAFLPMGDVAVANVITTMASGTPLLGSSAACIAELLTHEESALLCRPSDPRGAARLLLAILEDRPAAQRRAEAARGLATTTYAPQRMVEQFRRLYARILDAAALDAGVTEQNAAPK